MSLNTAHANNGVLIFAGEIILLYTDGVELQFEGSDAKGFSGNKKGRLYLTSHRMIFTNKNLSDPMQSFSFPFFSMHGIELEQPIFGANFIKGNVRAQAGGNWTGNAVFKLKFMNGGAIEYGQAMLQAAKMASQYMPQQPPAYTPYSGPYYPAPPPAYTPPPGGYGGFVPPTHVFPDAPPANSVFTTGMPPPYPGIYPPPYNGAQQSGYPPAGMPPQQSGYPQAGMPPQQSGYPPAGMPPQQSGYPQAGMPQQPPGYTPGGYPNAGPPPAGYPNAAPLPPGFNINAQQQQFQGMQNPSAPPPSDSNRAKEQEAMASAYYNPYNPGSVYVPQANGYSDNSQFNCPPPPYSEAYKKNQ